MKSQIKHNLKLRIVTFALLLLLSLTAFYFLTTSNNPEDIDRKPIRVVPAIAVLEEGRPIRFDNNNGTLQLIESQVSFPNCADCMETAKVEVTKGNEKQILNFRFGGIAGFHDDTAQAADYIFQIRELHDKSVILEFRKVSVK